MSMSRKRRIAIAVILSGTVVASASACSGSGVCDPGRLRLCTCGPGTTGVQSCLASGNGYEECQCSVPDVLSDPDADMTDVTPEEGEGSDMLDTDAMDADAADSPDTVSLLQHCLVGGNVIYLGGDEDDYIHPGAESFTDSDIPPWTWTPSADRIDPPYELVNTVHMRIESSEGGYRFWELDFSTHKLSTAITEGYYPDAMRHPFEDEGRPGLSISGDGRGCNQLSGWFEIHEVDIDDSVTPAILLRLTATFEQHCEGGEPKLLGCIRFE
jgi:hypothetical protein